MVTLQSGNTQESMMEVFIFETNQLIEQLENIILSNEKTSSLSSECINEIFRIMHTIKGSSAMMLFNNISTLAHSIEDLFYFIREQNPQNVDNPTLTDIVLAGVDFIKTQMEDIENGREADGDPSEQIGTIKEFLTLLKESNLSSGKTDRISTNINQTDSNEKQRFYISPDKAVFKAATAKAYTAKIFFEEGCEMECIRAFTIIHNLKGLAEDISYIPSDIIDNDDSAQEIRSDGFKILFKSEQSHESLTAFFENTPFLKEMEFSEVQEQDAVSLNSNDNGLNKREKKAAHLDDLEDNGKKSEMLANTGHQSMISVNVGKLDKLMDLVGELVISEAMVTQNPDLKGLNLDNFQKAARQLQKITNELQDTVMSIRMVPLSTTFLKMNRIVRDMSKKLNKDVDLAIIGEETEVDKNIIDHISDPLMHLIRNSIDHGIETAEERIASGKEKNGEITLEAKNSGGDVLILVKDDGKGLNKDKILKRARENGLINKPEDELTEKEIYSFIFLPGFSTKDAVTEYSGRGVGMDVVTKNIESVGGSVSVNSTRGEGTTIILKIPLTLAIIDGMTIGVGDSRYTIPITSIRESFKIKDESVIKDPDGNEMVMVRGICYPVLRLHELYKVNTSITEIGKGIIIMVENESKSLCIFADELIGEQQVVVKALPGYIKKVKGIAGCTLLGDGSISLILDVEDLLKSIF